MEFGVSFIVPLSGSADRRPLPSTGSRGSVPQLRRYYGSIGLLAVRLASLRFLRSAIPLTRRRQELPGSWWTLAHVPCSSTPAGPLHQAIGRSALLFGASVLPSASSTASAPTTHSFRGSIARPARSLSTLRSQGRPWSTQDSLPAGGSPWPVGTRTRWVQTKGFSYVICIPLSQASPGAPETASRRQAGVSPRSTVAPGDGSSLTRSSTAPNWKSERANPLGSRVVPRVNARSALPAYRRARAPQGRCAPSPRRRFFAGSRPLRSLDPPCARR
jgi:hypothetical protein